MVVQEALGYYENGAWYRGTYVTPQDIQTITEQLKSKSVFDYDMRPVQLSDTYALKDHTHDETDHDIVIELDYIPTLVAIVIAAITVFFLTMVYVRFI